MQIKTLSHVDEKNDEDAILRANGVDPGKITLNKISWFMPHLIPVDKDKIELYKIIERTEKIPVGYRMIQCDSNSVDPTTSFSWRLSVKSSPEVPHFIIVGFQTDKSSSQMQNPSIFDNANVRNIYVTLNSNKYPASITIFLCRNNNLVGRMVMPLNLDQSFIL